MLAFGRRYKHASCANKAHLQTRSKFVIKSSKLDKYHLQTLETTYYVADSIEDDRPTDNGDGFLKRKKKKYSLLMKNQQKRKDIQWNLMLWLNDLYQKVERIKGISDLFSFIFSFICLYRQPRWLSYRVDEGPVFTIFLFFYIKDVISSLEFFIFPRKVFIYSFFRRNNTGDDGFGESGKNVNKFLGFKRNLFNTFDFYVELEHSGISHPRATLWIFALTFRISIFSLPVRWRWCWWSSV